MRKKNSRYARYKNERQVIKNEDNDSYTILVNNERIQKKKQDNCVHEYEPDKVNFRKIICNKCKFEIGGRDLNLDIYNENRFKQMIKLNLQSISFSIPKNYLDHIYDYLSLKNIPFISIPKIFNLNILEGFIRIQENDINKLKNQLQTSKFEVKRILLVNINRWEVAVLISLDVNIQNYILEKLKEELCTKCITYFPQYPFSICLGTVRHEHKNITKSLIENYLYHNNYFTNNTFNYFMVDPRKYYIFRYNSHDLMFYNLKDIPIYEHEDTIMENKIIPLDRSFYSHEQNYTEPVFVNTESFFQGITFGSPTSISDFSPIEATEPNLWSKPTYSPTIQSDVERSSSPILFSPITLGGNSL